MRCTWGWLKKVDAVYGGEEEEKRRETSSSREAEPE